ncbi:leucine-rich repeat domain-containing protein [Brachyspira pulli]|uniref:leucine-rich repeat domain-containing protein n=1 Tax=Brachyspira pulli TaxID=310721 RepID=UPI0030043E75
MIKKILLVLLSVLVFASCSNKTTSPDSSNNGDNSGVTPPAIDKEEEELVKKYGIDISQDDAVISQKIEENLKAYFAEKNSYRVILTGTPKDYTQDVNESLYTLVLKAAVKVNTTMNIDLDIKNIDFKDSSVKTGMFSGEGVDNSENIFITFQFPENKIKTIEMRSFDNLSNTKEIIIPDSVITISESAFCFSSSIEKLILGKNVQTIGNSAFSYVQFLSEVIIPDSVKTIGEQAFANDTIQKLQLSSSLETIGSAAFINLEIEELVIPASVKTVGEQAFAYSFKALKRVVYYGDSPNIINYTGNVFEGCFSLSTLIIPNAKNEKDEGWKTFLGGSFTDIRKQ